MSKEGITDVEQEACCFDTITLPEMDHVKLMNRIDSKFLLPVEYLPEIMNALRQDYKVLEVEGHRLCDYQTLYFDTSGLKLYNDHRKGRSGRYKIRQRHYIQSDQSFTEIKFKNNKGRTNKIRIPNEGRPGMLDEESMAFVRETSPYNPSTLTPVLWVDYSRITLVNKLMPERLTLDFKLTFHNLQKRKAYPRLVIAEVKQDARFISMFTQLMKEYHFREDGMSKYCLGIINLYPNVQYNNLKPQLHYLQKIIK